MRSFKDTKGREWEIVANFGNYSRVRDKCKVDLTELVTEDRSCLTQLADPYLLGDVIWVMVERQAEKLGITKDEFSDSIDGDVWEKSAQALLDEMVFFCRPAARPAIEMMITKMDAARKTVMERIPEVTEKAAAEIDAALAELIRGSSGGNSPASSAATATATRSATSSSRRGAGKGKTGITPRRSLRKQRS